jgi:hypothetical protein
MSQRVAAFTIGSGGCGGGGTLTQGLARSGNRMR